MDDIEDRLRATLHEHADAVHPSNDMDQLTVRCRRALQRRRAMTTAVGGVVAVAVGAAAVTLLREDPKTMMVDQAAPAAASGSPGDSLVGVGRPTSSSSPDVLGAHSAAASEAAKALPGFGGIEIRRDTRRIVVYYTTMTRKQREKVIGDAPPEIFSFVRVDRTYADLSALRDRITADTGMWNARGLVIAQWGPDVRSNTVKVIVLKLRPEQKRLLIDRYGRSNITLGSVDQLETVGGGIK
jgi:hypothetical protein